MAPLTRRLERLEQHASERMVNSLADHLARRHGMRPTDLMAAARQIAERESLIGNDAVVQELAAEAGITAAQFMAEVDALDNEMAA